MRIATHRQPRRPAENVIAMINVVFLLLVFFLISARIAPPLPIEVELPTAEGGEVSGSPDTIVIGPDGTLHFAGVTGAEATARLADTDVPLTLRVDRGLDGAAFARALRDISAVSDAPLDLIVEP
ncbi:biopolymer transporter ExbD [uncultured Maritimibacter sp.]|uniref:biopolymer transporter ExbD n=1 Tax=uncultured Maritimibacter sp. TaxID=991866 RepID=UPI002591FBBE|nr:biopolymer transporter ExbD [uncultured Maritimibacter sp.]